MKKNTIVFFSLLSFNTLSAQEVVSAQGDSYTSANGNIDFTVGEVITNTVTDGTTALTQGFHQTNWNFLGLEDFAPDYDASIFPNPTSDVLNIRTSKFDHTIYSLYDAQGKLVLQDKLSMEQTPIQVSYLAPGVYSLELNFEDGNKSSSKSKTFKLVKSFLS